MKKIIKLVCFVGFFVASMFVLSACDKSEDISIANNNYLLFVGDERQLEVTNPSGVELSFKSSNEQVVSVDSTGKIKGVSGGDAKITIESRKNDLEVTVKVLQSLDTFTLNHTEIVRTIGDTDVRIQLEPVMNPDISSSVNVVYSVEGSAATVSPTGLVLINASRKGEATITALIEGTNYAATCKVIVKAIPIATAQELYAIRNDLTNDYELVADIDLSDFQSPVGIGWDPIGRDDSAPFMGSFNGNGYKITGLTINNPSQTDASRTRYFIGLFGYVRGATIENVYLENIDITAYHNPNFVGGIAGVLAEPCEVRNCVVTGKIKLMVPTSEAEGNSCAGGIVGELYDSIYDCYSAVNIYLSSAYSYAGGVVGGVFPKTVGTSDSPSVISVPYIKNCYYVGNIDGTRVAGVVYKATGHVVNCYYDKTVAPYLELYKEDASNLDNLALAELLAKYTSCENSKALTTEELQTATVFSGWDTENWLFEEGYYPRLKSCGAQNKLSDVKYSSTVTINDDNNYGDIVDIANITFEPSSALFNSITWTSSNEEGLYVSSVGTVYAYKQGEYTLTGKIVEGDLELTITVIVEELSNSFAGGVGTADSPYLIENEKQLNAMRENTAANYQLINDVVLTEEWQAIPNFNGVFDGNGYSISNLYITTTNDFDGGFVGFNGGTIKNVTFDGVNISGGNFVGAVAVVNYPTGIIENCFVSGYIAGTNIGGSISSESYGAITNCYSIATISTVGKAGGIVYQLAAENGVITNCYFAGSILNTPDLKTGVAYLVYYPSKVVSSAYVSGDLTDGWKLKDASVALLHLDITAYSYEELMSGDSLVFGDEYEYAAGYLPRLKGLTGQTKDVNIDLGTVTLSNIYNGSNISGLIAYPALSGMTIITKFESDNDAIVSVSNSGVISINGASGSATITITFIEGNTATLVIELGEGLQGSGTQADPFIINTYKDLEAVKANTNAYYLLNADIDMTGKNWEAITEFYGVFDGNGHKILNLTIDSENDMVAGFCVYNSGTIKNLGFVNAKITSTARLSTWRYTGGIAAVNRASGNIEKCYFEGTLKGERIVGGIAVENFGKITNTYVKANITAGEHACGIVFITQSGSELSNTYYYGNLTAEVLKYAIVIDVIGTSETTIVANNYFLSSQLGIFNGAFASGATALTEEELLSGSANLFAGFDTEIWEFVSGQTPTLK